MRYVVECSASTRECVVHAVLDRKRLCDDLSCLPTILTHETCEDYYGRCLDILTDRERALLGWWQKLLSRAQNAKHALRRCSSDLKACIVKFHDMISGQHDDE